MKKKKLPKVILRTATVERKVASDSDAQPLEIDDTPIDLFFTSDAVPEQRRAFAVKLVERFALWSGASTLVPIPFVDVAAVGALQIQMLRRISQVYGIAFSKNASKSLIASIAGTMIPATSAIGAASLFKSVPVVGTIVSGLTMPTLSAGATYAIGMTFIEHIVSGGSLLDFTPRNIASSSLKPKRESRESQSRPKIYRVA
jgi:uncharacterized protein (DUF697 family)